MSNDNTDYFGTYDPDRDSFRLAESRSEAEDRERKGIELGADPEVSSVCEPGELPVGETDALWCDTCTAETDHEVQQDGRTVVCVEHNTEPQPAADGGTDTDSKAVDPEIVDHSPGDETQPDSEDSVATDAPTTDAEQSLPDDPPVDVDPLTWMPGHFVDQIDGEPAINRKGYEVLAHHYDIGVRCDLVVPPEDKDHEFARARAVATTADGREYEAHAAAGVDRGDDSTLLTELADTRARKRALSAATGVGTIAVAELQHGGDSV